MLQKNLNNKQLDETMARAFGYAISSLIKHMFSGQSIPVSIKGTKQQVSSFSNTINREKDYIEAYKKYGLDNPLTFSNKGKLDKAITQFERHTGIEWPIKEEKIIKENKDFVYLHFYIKNKSEEKIYYVNLSTFRHWLNKVDGATAGHALINALDKSGAISVAYKIKNNERYTDIGYLLK